MSTFFTFKTTFDGRRTSKSTLARSFLRLYRRCARSHTAGRAPVLYGALYRHESTLCPTQQQGGNSTTLETILFQHGSQCRDAVCFLDRQIQMGWLGRMDEVHVVGAV